MLGIPLRRMTSVVLIAHLFLISLLILSLSQITKAEIVEVDIKGEINEGTVIIVEKAFEVARERNSDAILVILDTPGGLVSSTEKIVSLILNSEIPVITYVYPQGAFSASGGSFVLLSGHIAAMSNGTSTGAATPVGIGVTGTVVENKTINYIASYARSIAEKRNRPAEIAEKFVTESLSLTAKEAYEAGVIDFIADSKADLIRKINSKGIRVEGKVLHLDNEIVVVEKPLQAKIFEFISNPQIATVLFLIGLYGLIFGLTSPGILPETVGVVCLVLALFGFGAIGINTLGIILFLLGVIFLIAELLTPTYGVLGSASVICITLGALMLIDEPLMPKGFYESFRTFIIGLGIGLGALMTFLIIKVFQLRKERKKVGGEAIINQKGKVVEFENGEGIGRVRGELWKIESSDNLKKGDKFEVIEREGLVLKVRKV
ncbi:MAG: nodulation protein NfeD [Archaeoglobus sp.]|nr:nodulation protein NfeD [Archaeoglobus sp.]